jgi:hypothetical protein
MPGEKMMAGYPLSESYLSKSESDQDSIRSPLVVVPLGIPKDWRWSATASVWGARYELNFVFPKLTGTYEVTMIALLS